MTTPVGFRPIIRLDGFAEANMTDRNNQKRRRCRSRSRSRSRSRDRSAPGRRHRGRHETNTNAISSVKNAPLDRRWQCWYAVEYNPIQVGSIDGTDVVPHDKGLVRAMRTPFDAARDLQIQGDPYSTLFVARLNYATTEETLRDVFAKYGAIRSLRLVHDVKTHKSKGYAFIEFEDERGFRRAYNQAHRQVIDGSTVLVDYERSRVMPGWKPRRLGGGLGGRKESGQLRFGGRDHPFKPPAAVLTMPPSTSGR
ncbi:TPA: hypothetical protein N0F65_008209 [Lagenidium giganteum]|uniref:RRM domain-containing protein n=1 Tax=Lagenidium giganteum TaxID=4803 RepID=A0AAV2Z037_9STRA|nr:TPA: hypothetical protein N0F65_008209 [Lagenidium giganteum]